MAGEPVVADAPAQNRYEVTVDGELAGFVRYRRKPGSIDLVHTEIDPVHEGEGLGGVLVRAVLDAARAEGLAVLPFCPFARSWIERHPEYVDLVPAGRRAQFRLDS